MAVKGSRWSANRQKIFHSVFQPDISQPTPHSTPLLPSAAASQPFGVPVAPGLEGAAQAQQAFFPPPSSQASQASQTTTSSFLDVGEDQVRWDRAWHVVTSRIQLPPSVAVEDSFGALGPEAQDVDVTFYEALRLVLYPKRRLPQALHTEDLLDWHMQQVRYHLVQHVLPLLTACEASHEPEQVLLGCIRTLEAAHRQYLYGLSLIARGLEKNASEAAVKRFRRDLHAVIGNSMSHRLVAALRTVLDRQIRIVLGVPQKRHGRDQDNQHPDAAEIGQARQEVLQIVDSLHEVGLAGETFQVLFAGMMDEIMEDHIKAQYIGVWAAPGSRVSRPPSQSLRAGPLSTCAVLLSDWIENHYSRIVVEVFGRIGNNIVAWADVERWKETGLGRLTALRIDELFDIVLGWPETKGGLDDLRTTVTTPQRRLQLTDAFSAALQKRLLHPGRSTLDILQIYIAMIRTFHYLDHSKVLLDRVAHSLQLYLCQRDDAIRIVVSGLLSSPDKQTDKAEASDGKCAKKEMGLSELAVILNDPAQQQRRNADEDDQDWNDMEWVPPPIDAGVNYKRPKSEDVIGTLIGALGSQDVFIKEFQAIVAERLLSSQREFPHEIRVLNLLKRRFGENALQNCDVMLKDIADSRKVDAVVARDIVWPTPSGPDEDPRSTRIYHAKILSRLFWPGLSRQPFVVPPPVAEIRGQYERGYEQLKAARKLTWLDHLGRAAVHLDLEDRMVDTECETYAAAVIYAFQQSDGDGDASKPARRTAEQLETELEMDDELLDKALRFWVEKRVLRQVEPGVYVVLETLDAAGDRDGEAEVSGAGAGTDEAGAGSPSSPRKASGRGGAGTGVSAQELERRRVYWQFIVGMLTNSGPSMPLGQMFMMMKMLIADGFPWSNEELQEFLADKVASGDLDLAGGKYRLPKK